MNGARGDPSCPTGKMDRRQGRLNQCNCDTGNCAAERRLSMGTKDPMVIFYDLDRADRLGGLQHGDVPPFGDINCAGDKLDGYFSRLVAGNGTMTLGNLAPTLRAESCACRVARMTSPCGESCTCGGGRGERVATQGRGDGLPNVVEGYNGRAGKQCPEKPL